PAVIRRRVPVVVALAEVPPGDAVRRELVAYRHVVGLLRRHGVGRCLQAAVRLVAGVVVVQQVVAPWLAVVKDLVGQAVQVADYRTDSGLRRVRALRVAAAGVRRGPAAVAVLRVVVVGPRLRVRVLDLAGRGRGRGARRVLVRRGKAGAERDVVGAGAPLHRLVIVVADRVPQRQVVEDGRIALRHVVEAHRHRALVDRGGRGGAVVVSGRVGHPRVEPGLRGRGLLPHLVEAVQGVADVCPEQLALAERRVLQVAVEVGHVLGDLERPVGKVGGEPGVRAVAGQAVARRRHVGYLTFAVNLRTRRARYGAQAGRRARAWPAARLGRPGWRLGPRRTRTGC